MPLIPCRPCDDKYGTTGIAHGDKLPACPNSQQPSQPAGK